MIRSQKLVQFKESYRRYTRLCHVCLSNVEIPRKDYLYSCQLTNFILDSGATCHMRPEISDIIPNLLVKTDKHLLMGILSQQKKQDKFKVWC